MSGPIVRAVMAAINDEDFDCWPQFADWKWLRNYSSIIGERLSAAQSNVLSGQTRDHRDYCEMGYFMRTRSKGQLTDEVREYGILADAAREVRL